MGSDSLTKFLLVLIGDLECTPSGANGWRQTRRRAEGIAEFLLSEEPEVPGYGFKTLRHTEKRDDGAHCEHDFVPRLKVSGC